MQNQLELINEKLANIDKTLAVNTRELSHHIEQTLILRDEMKTQRTELNLIKNEQSRLKGFFLYLGWALTGLAGLATISYYVPRILH